jgi:hypothetical protein
MQLTHFLPSGIDPIALSKQLLQYLESHTKHHSLSFSLFPFPHLLQIPLLFANFRGEAQAIGDPTGSVALDCGDEDRSPSFSRSSSVSDSLGVLKVTTAALFPPPPVSGIGFGSEFEP